MKTLKNLSNILCLCLISFIFHNCSHDFDTVPPIPICVNEITVNLQPLTQNITIWASDVDGGSSDDCTNYGDLVWSFSKKTANNSLTFTCDDLGNNPVKMWVTDEAGNQAFCLASVSVQDYFGVCGGS